MSWIAATRDGVVLTLHIQPGAKKTEIVGLHGDALKIRLAAPPVDGRANACLLAFLAERLGVAKSRVELVSGETSRAKRVKVGGGDASTEVCLGDSATRGRADAANVATIRKLLGMGEA